MIEYLEGILTKVDSLKIYGSTSKGFSAEWYLPDGGYDHFSDDSLELLLVSVNELLDIAQIVKENPPPKRPKRGKNRETFRNHN